MYYIGHSQTYLSSKIFLRYHIISSVLLIMRKESENVSPRKKNSIKKKVSFEPDLNQRPKDPH